MTESEGQITSPYFDSVYPNNISCAWIIRVDSEQAELRLKFTAFDLEESINCTADHVEIRDGDSATAPIIGKEKKVMFFCLFILLNTWSLNFVSTKGSNQFPIEVYL